MKTTAAVPTSPLEVVDRLRNALNAHDLEAVVECFDPDYESAQPVHPSRAFSGIDQVRKNWGLMFAGVPDLRAEVVAHGSDGGTILCEWRWRGRRQDGADLDLAGVTVMGVEHGRIRWTRMYMEPVERDGPSIDAVVRELSQGPAH